MNTPARQSAAPLVFAACIGVAAVFAPVGLLLLPAVWAYAAIQGKPWHIALFTAVYAACAVYVYGTFAAACLTFLCLAAAAALYALQTRKVGNAYTVAAVAGAALVSLYALICLPGIISGEGAFAAVQKVVDASVVQLNDMAAITPGTTSEMAAQFSDTLNAYARAVPSIVVPALVILSEVLALANFLFFRLFMKRQSDGVTPLRPFRLWSIPQGLQTGFFIMIAGTLILNLASWDHAEALTNTLSVLVGVPLLLEGLCVVDFIIVRRGGNVRSHRIVTYLILGVLVWVAQMPLVMLGCFDQLFRFRARLVAPPPSQL